MSSPNELLDGSDALDASNAKVVDAPTLESNDDSSANDGHEDSSDDAPPDDVELKPHEVKKNNENVDVPDQPSSEEDEWGTINADTSVAYEQMPIQLTKFIELASQSVDAINKAVDTVFDTIEADTMIAIKQAVYTVFDTIEADTMIDTTFIDQFNERINAPTLESPDDSFANDLANNKQDKEPSMVFKGIQNSVKVKLPSFLSFKRIGRQKAKKTPTETPSPKELLGPDGSDALDSSNAEDADDPTLESPDDSFANDGQENSFANDGNEDRFDNACAVSDQPSCKEEDDVTEDSENADNDTAVVLKDLKNIIVEEKDDKTNGNAFHVSTSENAFGIELEINDEEEEKKNDGNVEGPCGSLALSPTAELSEVTNKDSNSFNFNIIDEAAAIEMAMNDEEKEEDSQNVTEDMKNADTPEGIINDTIAKRNPKGKLLSCQPIKRIGTWNMKMRAAVIELKTNDEEKEENNKNVKEDIQTAEKNVDTAKNITEDEIVAIVKRILSNDEIDVSPSKINRERSDATASDASASIASEDSFIVTGINGNELHNGKDLHDLSTFLHENQQVAYTMQDTLRLVYRVNEIACSTAACDPTLAIDRVDDAAYNSTACTTLFGWLNTYFRCKDEDDDWSGEEAEEGGKELMTQHVMVMKDISLIDNAVNPTKTVKFRNDLPKKYNEEESYMYDEEREGGEMKTRFSARIGDTRDLAEMMH